MLLTAAEIESACGASYAVVETSQGRDSSCQISVRREGAASALIVVVSDQECRDAARASVEAARAIATASDASREEDGQVEDGGDADDAVGQVFDSLFGQDTAAQPADIPDAWVTSAELPTLGDGGVRYVVDATAGIGVVTPTVVFSSGTTLAKLESIVVANRAGVCPVEALEPLARRIASRL